MRGKFAATIRQRPGTAVHVAGRQSLGTSAGGAAAPGGAGVAEHPLLRGSRLSIDRLWAQGRYWRLLRRLRPALVVVHAPELLPLTLLWQQLGPGRRFIYDVQENYALNIATQGVYRGLVRRALAAGLRWVEARAARRAAGITLAELSYADELPFPRSLPAGRVVVLENKYQPVPGEVLPARPTPLPAGSEPLRLLYSGTISVLNGVWEAIALTKELQQRRPGGARLTIIGYCQQPALLAQLEAAVGASNGLLTLIGGGELVPHARVVAEMGRHHFGLLPYRPHVSTERCRPTKLFEYLAHCLPVLLPPNPRWQALAAEHQAGLTIDFDQPAAAAAMVLGTTRAFYPQGQPEEAFWSSEGKKLWLLLDSIFNLPTLPS